MSLTVSSDFADFSFERVRSSLDADFVRERAGMVTTERVKGQEKLKLRPFRCGTHAHDHKLVRVANANIVFDSLARGELDVVSSVQNSAYMQPLTLP